MHDGLQLAQRIVEKGSDRLDEAVAAYEKDMFPRAVDLLTRSQASGEVLFAEDAPSKFRALLAAMVDDENETSNPTLEGFAGK